MNTIIKTNTEDCQFGYIKGNEFIPINEFIELNQVTIQDIKLSFDVLRDAIVDDLNDVWKRIDEIDKINQIIQINPERKYTKRSTK